MKRSNGDSSSIIYGLFAFIGIGKEDIIPTLVDVLNTYGTKNIAEAYLNCGKNELSAAAENWAKKNGYTIITGGSSPVSWGHW